MAMNVVEQIDFNEDSITKLAALIDKNIHAEKFDLVRYNTRSTMNYYFSIGLLQWRLHKDPSHQFKKMIEFATDISSKLAQKDPAHVSEKIWDDHHAIYVASLIGVSCPALKLDGLDHTLARAFFGNVLIDAADIADWPKYRDALPQGERYDLARRTDALYADLLAGRITPEVGVRLGEKLWEEREDHDYFQSGVSGGGNENHQLVDYQLGAILKKIGSTVPTIHAWVW